MYVHSEEEEGIQSNREWSLLFVYVMSVSKSSAVFFEVGVV